MVMHEKLGILCPQTELSYTSCILPHRHPLDSYMVELGLERNKWVLKMGSLIME